MNESTQVTYGAGTITAHMNSESVTEVAAPNVRFGDYKEALTSCFSKKELEAIDGGVNAEVNLNFRMLDELEDAAMATQFRDARIEAEKTYGNLPEGVYLEVEASKSLDGYEYTELEYFNSDVEIQIDIPLYLISEGRHFYAMSNDKGVCEIARDVDEEADTLSISTHSTPTYLLLYQDAKESLKENRPILRIKTQYLFVGAIVALLIIWRVVEHFHKKEKN